MNLHSAKLGASQGDLKPPWSCAILSHGECWESSNLTWRSLRKSNAEVLMHWWKGPVVQRCPLMGRFPHFPAWQTWIAPLVFPEVTS